MFAPNFKLRRHIIPNRAHQTAREPHAPRPAPMSWRQRLKRVFQFGIEHCGVCGGRLRVIACIETHISDGVVAVPRSVWWRIVVLRTEV